MPDTEASRSGSTPEPTKAWLVRFKVVNECEAIVYADSMAEARERFADGDAIHSTATGIDYRTGGVRVQRFPMEDR